VLNPFTGPHAPILASLPEGHDPCGAVVVIVSHGANGYGAFTTSGVQIPFPATITGNDERENANGDNKFVVKSYSEIVANPYDDVVLSMTAGEFLTPLAENGSLKSYQAELNAKMTVIKGALIADAFKNSIPPGVERLYQFPAALPALPAAQLNDPWGTPIEYSRFMSPVSCSSAPATNAVFQLLSRGQDANPAAIADDITVTVTVAEIVAIIATAGCNK
jgi:hypothetical protein